MEDFIHSENLISNEEKLLVALSGGMDSMFLLHCLIQLNYQLEVAHCNFGLRGEESDRDEDFVKAFCDFKGIKFHVKRFDTANYAKNQGISIQMAARDLRYAWFDQLRATNSFDKLLTAHHRTDSIETILLNLSRGTGLKGLTGMPAITGHIVRPLIRLSREEISDMVTELKIPYRDDSSNASDKYSRNRIRHHILPQFKEINPSFEQTVENTASIISQAAGFVKYFMQAIKKECVVIGKDKTTIDIPSLIKYPELPFVLFEIVSEYGFNADQVKDIEMSLGGISGKQFYSATHRITKASQSLIIEELNDSDFIEYAINIGDKNLVTSHHTWYFEVSQNKNISKMANEAVLDLSKLSFPLVVRKWKQGDKIRPIGMQGHKKVSDILIDKKLSVPEKEKVWVLVSGEEIVWINELVVSEDYKVTSETTGVLRVKSLGN